MSFFDGLRHRAYVLLRGEAYADEVRREMQFHRELDAIAASGNSLGSETYYREEVRRMTLITWIDRIRQDSAYAIRGLKRAPGFAAAVVLTLGLGIGVNAAMFTLLDRIFIANPDGVVRPNEIRRLYPEYANSFGAGRIVAQGADFPKYQAFRQALDSSVALAAYTAADSVVVRDGTTRLNGYRSLITPGYFELLGVKPSLGRFFTSDEQDIATPTPLIILSDAFWRRAFNADRGIIGRHLLVGPTRYTVIGVAQPGFAGIDLWATDFWTPANMHPPRGNNGDVWYRSFGRPWRMIARIPSASAEEQLLTIGTNAIRPVKIEHLGYDPTVRVVSGPIIEALGPVKRQSTVTLATRIAGVTLIVLILAVTNVMTLLLMRASRRAREIAVRRALGVSRARLIEQLTVESLALSLASGVGAVLFALLSRAWLRHFFMPDVHWGNAGDATRLTAGVFTVSVIVGMIGGFAPGWRAMRPDLTTALRNGARGDSRSGMRLRSALLAMQVALCAVLLVGAGLFVRSFDNVRSIDLGYSGQDMFFASPIFDDPDGHAAEVRTRIGDIARQLRASGDVAAVGYATMLPMGGASFAGIYVPGRESVVGGTDGPSSQTISPGFVAATGLTLEQGRDFTDADATGHVALVSHALARTLWPGESPIGKCFMIGTRTSPCTTVVGVVTDVHRMQVIEPPTLQYYVPLPVTDQNGRYLIVRASPGHETAAIRATQQLFRQNVTELVGLRIRTLDNLTEYQERPWRLGATLFTMLGVLALIVAGIGVYSVMAFRVSHRLHEMGVRIALGARRVDIVDLVLGDGLRVVIIGAVAGLVSAMLLGRLVASLLFGVVPADPSALLAAGTTILVIAAVACVIPGWRAARVNPVDALKSE